MSEPLPVSARITEERLPELFELPEQPALAEKARVFLHTGKISCKDDERCEEIMRCLYSGMSRRMVARKFGISRRTIDAIEGHMIKAGKLEPVKERLANDYLEIAAMANEEIMRRLEDRTMPANVLGMISGIATDKSQLLTGSATAIIEHKKGATIDDINALIAKLPAAGSSHEAAPGIAGPGAAQNVIDLVPESPASDLDSAAGDHLPSKKDSSGDQGASLGATASDSGALEDTKERAGGGSSNCARPTNLIHPAT